MFILKVKTWSETLIQAILQLRFSQNIYIFTIVCVQYAHIFQCNCNSKKTTWFRVNLKIAKEESIVRRSAKTQSETKERIILGNFSECEKYEDADESM